MRQTSALAVKEKHQMQVIHSRTEPRPPGMALRIRSKTASGPRSFVIKWLKRKVANDPKTKMNQLTSFFAPQSRPLGRPQLCATAQQKNDEQNWNRDPE